MILAIILFNNYTLYMNGNDDTENKKEKLQKLAVTCEVVTWFDVIWK